MYINSPVLVCGSAIIRRRLIMNHNAEIILRFIVLVYLVRVTVMVPESLLMAVLNLRLCSSPMFWMVCLMVLTLLIAKEIDSPTINFLRFWVIGCFSNNFCITFVY